MWGGGIPPPLAQSAECGEFRCREPQAIVESAISNAYRLPSLYSTDGCPLWIASARIPSIAHVSRLSRASRLSRKCPVSRKYLIYRASVSRCGYGSRNGAETEFAGTSGHVSMDLETVLRHGADMDLETVMSPGAGMNRNGAASKVGERRPLPADISLENRCCTSFLFVTCM